MILRGEHLYISEKEVRRPHESTERIVGSFLPLEVIDCVICS